MDLKNAIVNTFDTILSCLKYWIVAINGTNNTLDSMYMIYHMAVSFFFHNYKFDVDNYIIEPEFDAKWNKKFCKNLYLYYFKDYITDYWKKNRQVADLMRDIKNPESLNKYVKTISNDEWSMAFFELRNNQLEEVGSQINVKAKIFIDYLIKFKIMDAKIHHKNFDTYLEKPIDYEHIIPQAVFNRQLTSIERKSFPISSLGNICYLSSKDNKSKHDHTIYEYLEDRPSFVINKEYLSLISYPSKEEINFIDNRSEEFKTRYKEFIENRIDSLIKEMEYYLKVI